jgi:hypothetical protein
VTHKLEKARRIILNSFEESYKHQFIEIEDKIDANNKDLNNLLQTTKNKLEKEIENLKRRISNDEGERKEFNHRLFQLKKEIDKHKTWTSKELIDVTEKNRSSTFHLAKAINVLKTNINNELARISTKISVESKILNKKLSFDFNMLMNKQEQISLKKLNKTLENFIEKTESKFELIQNKLSEIEAFQTKSQEDSH